MGALGTQQQEALATAGRGFADIGQGMGALGTQQQEAELNAGRAFTDIGARYGDLEVAQQRALIDAARGYADIGQGMGALGTQQQQALATAGRGMADIGQTRGGLTAGIQELLAGIGRSTGSLYGEDTSSQLRGAELMGDLALQGQTAGLKGAAAMQDVGGLQQALDQRNIDVALKEEQAQRDYLQNQINARVETFKNIAPGVPTATVRTGVEFPGYQPSPLAQATQGALTVASLVKD